MNCLLCGKTNCGIEKTSGRVNYYKCNDCGYKFSNSVRQASITKISWRDSEIKLASFVSSLLLVRAEVAENVKTKLSTMRDAIEKVSKAFPPSIDDELYTKLMKLLDNWEIDLYVLLNNSTEDDKRAINTFKPEIKLFKRKIDFKHPVPQPATEPGFEPTSKTNFRKKILARIKK